MNIEGHSIVSLTLIRQGTGSADVPDALSGQKHLRPGKSLHLPPGKYRVEKVELEGAYQYEAQDGGAADWFELTADRPCELVVGAPLSPNVTAERHGRFLQVDYDLVDAAHRSYTKVAKNGDELTAPQFTVYRGNDVLGSGSFEYG